MCHRLVSAYLTLPACRYKTPTRFDDCRRLTMLSIRSDVEPINPSKVPLIITTIDTWSYAEVAMLTLLVYDTIITMDKEIKYFWSSPCKFVSLIYFVNRFVGILGAISGIAYVTLHANETLRLGLISVLNLSYWMTILLIDYILLIRVLALYDQEKNLSACLKTILGLEVTFVLGDVIHSVIYQEISVGRLAEGVTVCLVNGNPKIWGALFWAVPMLYATLLMVLALYKAAQHWRELAGFSQFNLLAVLIQDQAIYFILVIFCSVMGIVADQLFIPNTLLAYHLSALGNPSLLSVLGSHLLVHLKEAGERRANGGTSYRMTTMSSMQFS
ncbi:hypothetical protein DFH11DRAFT_1861489 [Phellopilus nigrolimitatus]|nr:hypothetical protein DFH11DRAFT_1861489 [Phellopilus nigrolimitatus]